MKSTVMIKCSKCGRTEYIAAKNEMAAYKKLEKEPPAIGASRMK